MLRKSLFAVALLAASAGAMAHDDYVYGRVVTVEPHFSISFGSGGYHDGFRILYDVGGRHYWTHSRHHPGHTIWVPRPASHHVHHHKHRHERHYRYERDGRWDDRRGDHRGNRGHYERYGRY